MKNPAAMKPGPLLVQTSGWRRWARVALKVSAFCSLATVIFIGAVVVKYNRIVDAKPGALHTVFQPGKLGQHVNPFAGTGGYPWVCGHNFPGAMMPFGMVRLGPETSSLLLHKRGLN